MAFDLGLNNLPDTEVAEHEGDTGSLRDENYIFLKFLRNFAFCILVKISYCRNPIYDRCRFEIWNQARKTRDLGGTECSTRGDEPLCNNYFVRIQGSKRVF